MRPVWCLITFSVVLPAQLHLERYPQKIVTAYRKTSPDLPAGVLQGATRELRQGTALWRPAPRGLVRVDDSALPPDRVQYFNGRRYLPDDRVEHLQSDADNTGVWVRTETGVSHIAMTPMSLEAKADAFEQRLRARHDRYGFVADSRLRSPGDLDSNQTDPNDNDGLWTAIYVGAQAFRYAVTKSPDALARGKRAMEAILFLEKVTGRPGLPARSYIRQGDQRGAGGVWHWTPDRRMEWKADTSSDELVGHFFAFALAWEFLDDPQLRQDVVATTRRVMDHIIDNGWNLIDVHGQPTYWGRWSEEYFSSPRGQGDSPLNAVELLSFLKVAHQVTGDDRYHQLYRRVAYEMGYLKVAATLLDRRRIVNYSDEELVMLPFYLLFRYEKDPAVRAALQTALDLWWQNIRREKNPLWSFIYQTANPRTGADLAAAIHTLYRIPMDLRTWRVENSWRTDLQWAGAPDRFGRREATTWLPPDERPVMKWNGNPFIVDGGDGGRSEDDGAFFLLPYWLGRFEGLIPRRNSTR